MKTHLLPLPAFVTALQFLQVTLSLSLIFVLAEGIYL